MLKKIQVRLLVQRHGVLTGVPFVAVLSLLTDRRIDNSSTELPTHAAVTDTVRLCRHNHEHRMDRRLERMANWKFRHISLQSSEGAAPEIII
jgi:hypothetical protein